MLERWEKEYERKRKIDMDNQDATRLYKSVDTAL